MENNPLKQYFRQPSIYVKLPSKGRWYGDGSVEVSEDGEVPVYPMAAIDDIMLNTPDAMLNGHALEKVITNCVPSVKDPKRLVIPDLEAIFVGIKAATNNGTGDYDRKCPSCQHDNSFELNCQALLDGTTFIDEGDLTIKFGSDLVVHVKPYDFEMRQLFIRREFEEEKTIRAIDAANENMDEIGKAAVLADGVDRLAQITFSLVARSIEKVVMIRENITVLEPRHISEWLMEISKPQADIVIDAVNKLNNFGVTKTVEVRCESCGHTWNDPISFDPTSFFGKRS
jgi:hypothetical protein